MVEELPTRGVTLVAETCAKAEGVVGAVTPVRADVKLLSRWRGESRTCEKRGSCFHQPPILIDVALVFLFHSSRFGAARGRVTPTVSTTDCVVQGLIFFVRLPNF